MKSSWRSTLCGLLVLTPLAASVVHATTVTTVASNFPANGGIAIDTKGDFYVSNWNDRRILKITPEREISTIATIPGTAGQWIANMVYLKGKLYIAGFSTNRVWQVTLDGTVSVLAGSGVAGRTDGEALAASFNQPNGIAVANSREALYILDVGGASASIRRIDLGEDVSATPGV